MRPFVLVVLVGCQSSSPPAPSPPPPPKPIAIDAAVVVDTADRAYVSDATGLVEVSPTASNVIVPGAIAMCNVDARANVVWYQTDDGLFAFDLSSRKSIPIIKHDIGDIEPIIDWGNEKLGGENPLAFQVGISLDMAKQTLSMVMGCEGDAAVYCFEDDGKTPTKAVKQKQKLAKKLALVDPAAVAQLAARGQSRSLWSPPPMPQVAPKPPKLDATRCTEIPEDCGKLTAIPGSSLWLLTTANSRGDYFHETRELWDPATGELVKATPTGVTRKQTPAGDDEYTSDYANLRVSTRGALSFEGFVFDPKRVIYAPKDSGKTCGWSSGGWRVKWGGE
jgi:hypothetical protein